MIGIFRPVNLLLLFAVQFTLWHRLCLHHHATAEIFNFILLTISVICCAAAGYVINDIFDIETDRINKTDRVFIDRKISKKNAFMLYNLLNCWALGSAVALQDIKIILITSAAILLLFFYSKNLKNTILTGNLTVALLSILPIIEIYLYFDAGNSKSEFAAYAIFAFLTTVLREIVKDREDQDGDLKSGVKTLANSISNKKLKLVLFILNILLLATLVGFIFYLNNFKTPYFLIYILLMIIPSLIIFALIIRLKYQSDYSFLSLFIKIYMFLGLILLWI